MRLKVVIPGKRGGKRLARGVTRDLQSQIKHFQHRLAALHANQAAQANVARTRQKARTSRAKVIEGSAYSSEGFVAPWLMLKPERRFRLFVPEHRVGERLPLLVMIHGCRQSRDDFEHGTRMSEVAEREHFAVLYPEQTSFANLRRCWNWFDPNTASGRGECSIIREMIERAFDAAPCDRSRIYVAGLSSGAALAGLLAFHYPSQFAAVAMHSGLPPLASPTIASAVAAMKRGVRVDREALAKAYWSREKVAPAPLLVLHGDEDERVDERNGTALVKTWEALFEAEPGAPALERRSSRIEAAEGVRAYTRTQLLRDGEIVVCGVRVHGLAHAWSGGDAEFPFNDAKGPNASEMIWEFVKRFSRTNE
ncbi:MAG: phospholipase [Burkholderiales bacterium]|nr:MAG: phospholipase [Burkholderiales bacterium]